MYQFETRRLLKPVDDLLRCGICFEYFDIAMIIPQCSHNYCSLCVRKFLSYKTQCPICCATVTEPELRNNRLLDELVKCFRSVRELLLECDLEPSPSPTQTMPKSASEKPPGGPRGHANMAPSITAMERFLTRSPSSKLAKATLAPSIKQLKGPQQGKLRAIAARTASVSSDNTALPSESIALCTEAPSTSSLAAKVQCPICSVDISEANINRHLDNCLAREDKIESLRSTTMKRKLMPKVVYNLLSDRDLKKRLKECGLSSQGTKAQLIKRHQAFVQMYNAQCDSLNPQSAAEIVKKIESNEKSQAQLEKQASQNVLKFSKNQSEKEIDEIHTNYRKKHQREFQQLIDKLKNRGNERKVKCEEKESKIEGYFLTFAGKSDEESEVLDCTVEQTPQCETDVSDELVSSSSLPRQETPEFQPAAFPTILNSPSTTASLCSSNSDICQDLSGSQESIQSPHKEPSVLNTRKRQRQKSLKTVDSQRKRAKN